ncbi:NUDIX hydrolase [Anaeromyxobacter oryzae]|uniref:NUDIX hydrolase n=1 Tax=Anaeromyxobacter oryzae TaxID=2918170 RepID=A0ABM7WV09_9BACT|nr:NUDIX domain-containing protein [Anaeromyxobacter oryzae]BDG03296.1 NUDIX hydrolase [Anaeromyxobacter oryzae]
MTGTRRRRTGAEADGGERAFLAGYDARRYPHPSLTTDVVLVSAAEGTLHTLVVRRGDHPDKGKWALPGGFVRLEEGLDAAAARVLADKAGLEGVFLEQLYTFGEPGRDPRTRVVTVAYYALVDHGRFLEASRRSSDVVVARIEVPWDGETGGPVALAGPDGGALPLAFDHAEIVGMAVKRLRGKLDYTPVGFQLLPAAFTLLELQRVHETVLGRPLNKDSFRRRMLASGELEATGRSEREVDHRPAELYRFARRRAI